jgi:hypothetical protein
MGVDGSPSGVTYLYAPKDETIKKKKVKRKISSDCFIKKIALSKWLEGSVDRRKGRAGLALRKRRWLELSKLRSERKIRLKVGKKGRPSRFEGLVRAEKESGGVEERWWPSPFGLSPVLDR